MAIYGFTTSKIHGFHGWRLHPSSPLGTCDVWGICGAGGVTAGGVTAGGVTAGVKLITGVPGRLSDEGHPDPKETKGIIG